ncbi:MAG: lysine--tRNA ligase [Promethearchaeota archaeon]
MISEHWLEEIKRNLLEKKTSEFTLATGKTPSGHIHVGILREIIICDSLRRILEKEDKKPKVLLFLDSLDAAKRFPEYISSEFQNQHLGKPFAFIPCPFKNCGCESYAHHFGNELISTFKDFGINNEVIWAHELYKTKEMQEKIKIALENNDKIKKILKKYILPTLDDIKKEQFIMTQKKWMPVMVICEKCDKIQYREKGGNIYPNRVIKYDNKKEQVSYECPACGHKAETSIYSGRLKLNWRVDWPAKWAIYGTTCEPAGKDHCVKGGSYDTGLAISKEVFNYEGPVKVAYEWLRLGDRDMKTSKGIVFTPKRYLELGDPEIFRMLILRTDRLKHISLRIEEMPQYYDFFEKMENIFYDPEKSEYKEENIDLKYIYPLVKVKNIKKKKPLQVPFKILSFFSQIQNILSLEKLYGKAKSILGHEDLEDIISVEEFKFLLERTKNWIDEVKKIIENTKDPHTIRELTQKITIFTIQDEVNKNIINNLSEGQIKGIGLVRKFFIENDILDADVIQNTIFTISKETLNIKPKKLFEAIYLLILGKKFGPRLGSFLLLLDKEWLIDRLTI